MKMKKISLLVALAGALTSIQCFALDVNVNRYAGYVGVVPNEFEGGEFSITGATPADTANPVYQGIISHYNAVAISTVDGGFESFCLDISQPLLPNPQSATPSITGVSKGVAWLYAQFVSGNLAAYGYDYTVGGAAAAGGTGTGRANSAFQLQNAIWELQGQTGYDAAAAAGFVADAIAATGSLADALAPANGLFGVGSLILQYPTRDGSLSQPMLAMVPDGGSTLILLGLMLGGMAFISRKLVSA